MKKILLAATVIAFAGITALSAHGNQSSQIKMVAVQDTVKTDSTTTTSSTESSSTVSQDTSTVQKDSTDKKQ